MSAAPRGGRTGDSSRRSHRRYPVATPFARGPPGRMLGVGSWSRRLRWEVDPDPSTLSARTVVDRRADDSSTGEPVTSPFESRRSGSNRRPAVYKTAALPTELLRRRARLTSWPSRRRRAIVVARDRGGRATFEALERAAHRDRGHEVARSRARRESRGLRRRARRTSGRSATSSANDVGVPSASSPTDQTPGARRPVEQRGIPRRGGDRQVLDRARRGLHRRRA